MAQKFKSTKQFLRPDAKFNDLVVERMVNFVMQDGKKTKARDVIYSTMDLVGKRIKEKEPLDVLHMAINNVKPLIEVRSKRVGGASYQVPMEINKNRQLTLAMRWIVEAAREKKGRPMFQKLADELCDAYKRQGVAVKKRENIHRMAEANKAFAHFAW